MIDRRGFMGLVVLLGCSPEAVPVEPVVGLPRQDDIALEDISAVPIEDQIPDCAGSCYPSDESRYDFSPGVPEGLESVVKQEDLYEGDYLHRFIGLARDVPIIIFSDEVYMIYQSGDDYHFEIRPGEIDPALLREDPHLIETSITSLLQAYGVAEIDINISQLIRGEFNHYVILGEANSDGYVRCQVPQLYITE
tara:strand:+ start:128 stop:709 length:582 start_codon:yes stop_codon:yes gene_type:complete